MISENSIIKVSQNTLYSEVDKEAIILGLSKGKYYSFNNIGSQIWKKLDKPIKVKDIIQYFLSSYTGEKEVIKQDILDFLNSILEQELIEEVK